MERLKSVIKQRNELLDTIDDALSGAELRSKRKLNDPSFTGWLLSSGCGALLGWLIYGLVLNSTYPSFVSNLPFAWQLLNVIVLGIPIALVASIMYTFYNNRGR